MSTGNKSRTKRKVVCRKFSQPLCGITMKMNAETLAHFSGFLPRLKNSSLITGRHKRNQNWSALGMKGCLKAFQADGSLPICLQKINSIGKVPLCRRTYARMLNGRNQYLRVARRLVRKIGKNRIICLRGTRSKSQKGRLHT